MKKLQIFSLLSVLLLNACGGAQPTTTGETKDSNQAFYFTYKTAEFEMEVPDDWEILDAFTSEYPKDLRVAFKNNIKDSIFTTNITVLREENLEGETSYDYAQRKVADHKKTLLNYALLSQEVLTLNVNGAESKTTLSTFEGKNSSSGPSLTFMQFCLSKADKAWTVTATYRDGEDPFTIEEIETMLRSFTLK